MGARTPKPGTEVTVGLPWTAYAGVATQSVRLRAPDLSREFNGGIKFTSVLDCGHVDAVLALFAALVHERRVVVTSSRLEALSGAVQAANASLYPLSWQHIFLPVMLESFLDYLTAPMPFLVGVHASLVPEMKKLPCDDVFVLDLDDGSFTYFEEDFDAMPSGALTLLRVGLLREIERSRGEDSGKPSRAFFARFSPPRSVRTKRTSRASGRIHRPRTPSCQTVCGSSAPSLCSRRRRRRPRRHAEGRKCTKSLSVSD